MKKTMITKKIIITQITTVHSEYVEKHHKDMKVDLIGFADYFYCYFYKNRNLDYIEIQNYIKEICNLNGFKLA